jgi:hypothetical protein
MDTKRIGDVIGDWFVRGLGALLVIGLVGGLLKLAGEVWVRSPLWLLVGVGLWAAVGLAIWLTRREPGSGF